MAETFLSTIQSKDKGKTLSQLDEYLEKNKDLFTALPEVYLVKDESEQLKKTDPRWLIEKDLEGTSGGYGKVLKAYDKKIGRFNAIKVLHSSDKRSQELILAEARTLAELDHPNILKVDALTELDGNLAIVCEWIGPEKGMTLSEYMAMSEQDRRVLQDNNKFSPEFTVDLFLKTSRELSAAADYAAHHGRAHFDIKPQNVMLTKNGVKLIDFGTALGVDQLSSGTPYFMPPERHFSTIKPESGGQSILDQQKLVEETTVGEVFSVAATLASFLLGESIFSKSTQSLEFVKDFHSFYDQKIAPRIAKALEKFSLSDQQVVAINEIFRKALHPIPTMRYADSVSFDADLNAAFQLPNF